MTEKEEKHIKYWAKNIERGRNTYIFKYTIFWTLWMAFFTPLLMMIFDLDFSIEYITSHFSFTKTIVMLSIQVIAAISISFAIWNSSTKKYNKLTNSK